jgi:hypothetical protein
MTGINKGKLDKPRNPAGRHKGKPNRVTVEFKEAVNNLISFATPQMVDWLTVVAAEDPNKALEHVYKFAQFGYPLLARTDNHNLNTETSSLTKEQRDAIYASIKS